MEYCKKMIQMEQSNFVINIKKLILKRYISLKIKIGYLFCDVTINCFPFKMWKHNNLITVTRADEELWKRGGYSRLKKCKES